MHAHDTEVLATFAEESAERLQGLEAGLLELERTLGSPSPDLLDAVFRDAHSVKAGANLLGLRGLERAAHSLENVLDRMRKGHLALNEDVISALLEGVDLLRDLLGDTGTPDEMRRRLDVLSRLACA